MKSRSNRARRPRPLALATILAAALLLLPWHASAQGRRPVGGGAPASQRQTPAPEQATPPAERPPTPAPAPPTPEPAKEPEAVRRRPAPAAAPAAPLVGYSRETWSIGENDRVSFIDTDLLFQRALPADARIVFSVSDGDPLLEELLASEFASNGKARLLADRIRAVAGTRAVDASAPGRMLESEAGNAIDLRDRRLDWPAPDAILSMRTHSAADAATVWSLSGGDSKAPGTCLVLESVSARDGVVTRSDVLCGADVDFSSRIEAAVGTLLGSVCRSHALVAVVPVQDARGNPLESYVAQRLFVLAGAALNELGCRVQDVKLEAAAAPLPNAPSMAGSNGASQGWRYHERLKGVSYPAAFDAWLDGNVFVEVQRAPMQLTAGGLVKLLSRQMPVDWLDPDLRAEPELRVLSFDEYRVRVVAIETGEVLTVARVSAGRGTPKNVVAAGLAEVVVGGKPRAWLELHRMPDDAVLRLDGKLVGVETRGPLLARVDPGTHKIDLLEGSRRVTGLSVTVPQLGYGTAVLVVPTAQLFVETDPPGAEILVDGSAWGPSPVRKHLSAGDHEVVAEQAGCGRASTSVRVLGGRDAGAFIHLPGSIQASAIPESASITIGQRTETGTLLVDKLPFGPPIAVTFRLPGFAPKTKSVSIRSCVVTKVEEQFKGLLNVRSDPGGAVIKIDGATHARVTPLNGELLPAGRHEVTCGWCGYGEGRASVQLGPGETQTLDIALVRPTSFALELGADVGMLDGLNPGLMGRLGGWVNGRFGLLAEGRVTGNASSGAAFLRARLLPFGPGWNVPIGAGVTYDTSTLQRSSRGEGQLSSVAPGVRVEARRCLAGGVSWGFGGEVSTNGASAFTGFTWQSGSSW